MPQFMGNNSNNFLIIFALQNIIYLIVFITTKNFMGEALY